jgi:predicted thioredoxin/glutaredoxin
MIEFLKVFAPVLSALFAAAMGFACGYAWGLVSARRYVKEAAARVHSKIDVNMAVEMRCLSIMSRNLFDACVAAGIDTKPIIEKSHRETCAILQAELSGKDAGYGQDDNGVRRRRDNRRKVWRFGHWRESAG